MRLVEQRPRGLHRAGANGRRPSQGPQKRSKKSLVSKKTKRKRGKRVFISSESWLSPQLARRRDVPADMTPEEDERVESVDLEDGSALLSRDGPTAASDAGVRLPAFGGDVTFLERSAFGAPLWAWAQLAAAVLAISTAGIAFDQLPEVPPLRLASWRMQATSLVLLVGAQREWRAADACTKNFALRRDTLVLLVV